MSRHPRRIHASTIAALIALVSLAADRAMAGVSKPHAHAQSAVPHHNAANNAQHHQQATAQHQQHHQALMQQQFQHQQALIMQHQQHQQALIVQHQQALMHQRQQSIAGHKAATNSSVSAKSATTGSVNPGIANTATGAIAGLTNPRFTSRRQYSPYSTGGLRNGNNSRQNHQLVSELHSARNLLMQADHDYNGHRGRAVHEVGQAIHVLSGQSHSSSYASYRSNTGTGNRTGNLNNGQNRMPQAQSDQHLRQALQALMNVQSRMANGGNSTHQRAHLHVLQATRELNVALNIP